MSSQIVGPDDDVAEAQQQQVVARGEVAVLVEDAVVRQEALAVDGADLAVREDVAGVVEVGVEVRRADERDDAVRRGGDLLDRAPRGADERRPQQQILRRVAGDDELGKSTRSAPAPRASPSRSRIALAVAVEVADDAVHLGERESHSVRSGGRFSPLDLKL